MADKKGNIIIVKKKKGGHGAAHGGAWKVAFADFMTAMMAFFLVMWLLGSDEEVKSQVAHYFNNPTSAWRPDLASNEIHPLGEWTGQGDDLLKGQQGKVPEDLVERPSREFKQNPEERTKDEFPVVDIYGNNPPEKMAIEVLKFSVAEHHLFAPGTDKFLKSATPFLEQLLKLSRGFGGKILIRSYTEPTPDKTEDAFGFSMTRVVALKDFLVTTRKVMDENRVIANVKNGPRPSESEESKSWITDFSYDSPTKWEQPRKIEFVFKGKDS